jgi:hypothetical protein
MVKERKKTQKTKIRLDIKATEAMVENQRMGREVLLFIAIPSPTRMP